MMTIRRESDPVTPKPIAKVVDLTAYRAKRDRNRLPLFDTVDNGPGRARRVLSDNEVAHREQMLEHLGGRAR